MLPIGQKIHTLLSTKGEGRLTGQGGAGRVIDIVDIVGLRCVSRGVVVVLVVCVCCVVQGVVRTRGRVVTGQEQKRKQSEKGDPSHGV